MFKNILVPLDGSKHSRTALDYSIQLAKRFNANLIGLHVVDVVALEGPFLHDLSGSLGFEPFLNFSSRMREILEEKGQGILKEFSDVCQREGVKGEVFLDFGVVTTEVAERAKVADLVVMGRRGINVQFEYGLLGSTAEGVIRRSPKPVMIVPEEYQEIKNPLLAYDGGFHASRAMHSAAEFVMGLELLLTVLTVSKDGGEKIIKEAEDYLKPYQLQARFILLKGDTPHEIVKYYYNEHNHDLLFMGVSSHSRIYEMVLGSTTEYVMRNVRGAVWVER
ncbi:MAG: universal stress protein [Deltaproteobacteria bacterium]|nr:universal stress protein [Deltaproteobacteria bacterium]